MDGWMDARGRADLVELEPLVVGRVEDAVDVGLALGGERRVGEDEVEARRDVGGPLAEHLLAHDLGAGAEPVQAQEPRPPPRALRLRVGAEAAHRGGSGRQAGGRAGAWIGGTEAGGRAGWRGRGRRLASTHAAVLARGLGLWGLGCVLGFWLAGRGVGTERSGVYMVGGGSTGTEGIGSPCVQLGVDRVRPVAVACWLPTGPPLPLLAVVAAAARYASWRLREPRGGHGPQGLRHDGRRARGVRRYGRHLIPRIPGGKVDRTGWISLR